MKGRLQKEIRIYFKYIRNKRSVKGLYEKTRVI